MGGLAESRGQVELVLSSLTCPESPIFCSIGINKCFSYLLESLEGRVTPHRGVGPRLHSFCAQVMLLRDPQKLYMVAAPVPEATAILKKAFGSLVAIGSSQDWEKHNLNTLP